MQKVDGAPFDEIYQRLAEMSIKVSGRQQECVGGNALP